MLNPLLTLKKILQESAHVECQDQMVDGVVQQIATAMKVDVCSVYLMEDNQLVLSATKGLKKTAINKIRMPPGRGLAGTIAANQHLLNLQNGSEHPAYIYFEESGEEHYKGFLGVPLIFQGKTIGVLVVQVFETRKFNELEEAFLVTLAAHLAAHFGHSLGTQVLAAGAQNKQVINIQGVRGAPGIAMAKLLVLDDDHQLEDMEEPASQGADEEKERLSETLESIINDLKSQRDNYNGGVNDTLNALLEVYIMLLNEKDVQQQMMTLIEEQQYSAEAAVKKVFTSHVNYFNAIEDPYLRARAEDFRVLAGKLYRRLIDDKIKHIDVSEPVILAGKMINVSHLARFDERYLAGVVSSEGSALSHTSVLASALGIPAIMGIDFSLMKRLDGKDLILDGQRAQLIANAPETVTQAYIKLKKQAKSLDNDLSYLKDLPAETHDGARVHLYSNTGLLADIRPGLERGAEGIGLYRSEMPFMMNSHFPTEEEQIQIYTKILDAYHPRPVTMRTLDVGGDKPLPYFPITEENPFLGWRGIRFSLDYSNILLEQIRAMLIAAGTDKALNIMMPMFSRLDELDRFIHIIDQALDQLKQENISVKRPRIGVMIEVPSSMWLLQTIKDQVDFVSIGSNDLTQYLLAVDRNNIRVSAMFDYLHPSVLQAHRMVIQEANRLKLDVSVCGEMASDPQAVVLLLGMGLRQLSMSAFKLPRIKSVIRHLEISGCRSVTEKAMKLNHESEIRVLIDEFLVESGAERLMG